LFDRGGLCFNIHAAKQIFYHHPVLPKVFIFFQWGHRKRRNIVFRLSSSAHNRRRIVFLQTVLEAPARIAGTNQTLARLPFYIVDKLLADQPASLSFGVRSRFLQPAFLPALG